MYAHYVLYLHANCLLDYMVATDIVFSVFIHGYTNVLILFYILSEQIKTVYVKRYLPLLPPRGMGNSITRLDR